MGNSISVCPMVDCGLSVLRISMCMCMCMCVCVFCHSVGCDFVTLLCVTLSHGCVWQFFFVSYCGYADFCGHLG